MSYKDRIRKAIDSYSQREGPKVITNRKNEKPEAEFLLLLKKYLHGLGWDMTVIEAKANYSESSGRYTHGAVASGYPDMSGNMPSGLAAYIEVKAPGKRNTIRPAQREFLIGKIGTNCFAIVCDSVKYFEQVHGEWLVASDKKSYLLSQLPELAGKYRDDVGDIF